MEQTDINVADAKEESINLINLISGLRRSPQFLFYKKYMVK